MSRELERLRKKSKVAVQNIENLIDERAEIEDHLQQVCNEYWRVSKLAGQAGYVLDQIDEDFQKRVKLNQTDIVLLFLGTALQCIRQYLIPNEEFRFNNAKQGDDFVESVYDKSFGKIIQPSWKDILFNSVPYDATKKGPHVPYNTGLAGTTHRYRTLGHDPVFGWVFGTANIMTNSLIKYDFETFQVNNQEHIIVRHYPLGAIGMMTKATEYAAKEPKLLGMAVARQAIHYGSDFFTKQGLPVPGIMLVNNNLAKDMIIKWHIDTYSVVRGTLIASLINQLISCIHRMFYDERKDGSLEIYEVKTRKILSMSNALATGSNVIITAISKDVSKLDIGGIFVTISRLVSDYNFIHSIKEDFLKNTMNEKILGKEYSFLYGGKVEW